jgi:ABC-type multidrug transport system ATPase subunit
MKQKLLAALALACEAEILVCDEPTASLDADARAAFFELVQARPRSSSLVLCSHRLEEVRQLVDRVVELKEGRIVSDEPASEVLRRLPTCYIELCFDAACLAGPDLDQLERWGFERLDAARFRGHFTQADKLDRIERSVARYANRLVDMRVVDSESLPSSPATSMRRAS